MTSDWRTIRIFISSTFRDMHSERDYLVKVVFPVLRERLEPHRVHLVDIDLRWGITEEQAENDEVLDLCLDQVDECRPFFVGLLGERYGWVPKRLPPRQSKHGWTQYHTRKSVTELEIRRGVLLKPGMHGQALFFFRDPSFTKHVPAAMRGDVEVENAEATLKLAELKSEILAAPLEITPVENYPCQYAGLRINWGLARLELSKEDAEALEEVAEDGLVDNDEYDTLSEDLRDIVHKYGVVHLEGLEDFGRQVLDRLWNAIRKKLKLRDTTSAKASADPLHVERQYHERFMESRLRVYVGRQSVQEELAKFAEGSERIPALLTGPSGSGKSAALANFVDSYSRAHPESLVIPHFVGASPNSTGIRHMLHRICSILKRTFRLDYQVPRDSSSLAKAFRQFIEEIPPTSRVVLVIDALNQLDETEHAQKLQWLPSQFPEHFKVVASCIDDPDREELVLQVAERREHLRITVPPLTATERFDIVWEVPSLSAKSLDLEQIERLVENPATENPLYLLVAIEELRGFGSFEQLNSRIAMFPQGEDALTELFVQVIHRLQGEFDPFTVYEVLSLLATARRGLSDRELLDLIEGTEVGIGESRSDLFPILRLLRPYLQHRGDLWDFFHRNFYKAVREQFLADKAALSTAHARLAEYFQEKDYFQESPQQQRARADKTYPNPRPVNVRKVDELPWHLLQLMKQRSVDDAPPGTWEDVSSLFLDLEFLEAKAEAGEMVFDLADDFAGALAIIPDVSPQKWLIRMLDEALRRDIQFIDRHPTTLFQCMWNTCWWYDSPEAAAHYDPPDAGWPAGGAPWEQSRPKLSDLLARWREQRIPKGPWLRSLRPPMLPLGGPRVKTFRGHEGPVGSILFTPNGQYMVTFAGEDDDPRREAKANDHTVRVWDHAAGTLVATFAGHTSLTLAGQRCIVRGVRCFPDSTRIASIGDDAVVRVWEAATGTELLLIGGRASAWVDGFDLSPDGQRLLTVNSARPSGLVGATNALQMVVRTWDATSGKSLGVTRLEWTESTYRYGRLKSTRGKGRWFSELTYMGDSRHVAVFRGDHVVRIRNPENETDVAPVCGHEDNGSGAFRLIAYAPSRRHVNPKQDAAMGTAAVEIRVVWDTDEDAILMVLPQSLPPHWDLAISADRRRLACCDRSAVLIWDAKNDKHELTLCEDDFHPTRIGFSTDGRQVVAGGENSFCVWDAHSGALQAIQRVHQSRIQTVAFVPNGNDVAVGYADNSVRIWDVGSSSEPPRLRIHDGSSTVGQLIFLIFSLDGQLAATGHGSTLCVWCTEDGIQRTVIRTEGLEINAAGFSPDGRQIVIGCGDSTVRICDIETGTESLAWRAHQRDAMSVAFSPDGRLIASGSTDETVRIWNAADGDAVAILRGHVSRVTHVGFAPDGKSLVSKSADGEVRHWDYRRCETLTGSLMSRVIRLLGGKEYGITYKDCLKVASDQGRTFDLSTRGAPNPRYTVDTSGSETSIVDERFQVPIAWWPETIDQVTTHPTHNQWCGLSDHNLCLLRMEEA